MLVCVKCLALVGTETPSFFPLPWETKFMAHKIQASSFLVHMGKLRRFREGKGLDYSDDPANQPQNPADQL